MSHEVETMAFANETRWHGLGNPVSNDMTPQEMSKGLENSLLGDGLTSKRRALDLTMEFSPIQA